MSIPTVGSTAPRAVIVLLHGHGRSGRAIAASIRRDWPQVVDELVRLGVAVVCPTALGRDEAGKTQWSYLAGSADERLVQATVAQARERAGLVGLAGESNGAFALWAMMARNSSLADAWAPCNSFRPEGWAGYGVPPKRPVYAEIGLLDPKLFANRDEARAAAESTARHLGATVWSVGEARSVARPPKGELPHRELVLGHTWRHRFRATALLRLADLLLAPPEATDA